MILLRRAFQVGEKLCIVKVEVVVDMPLLAGVIPGRRVRGWPQWPWPGHPQASRCPHWPRPNPTLAKWPPTHQNLPAIYTGGSPLSDGLVDMIICHRKEWMSLVSLKVLTLNHLLLLLTVVVVRVCRGNADADIAPVGQRGSWGCVGQVAVSGGVRCSGGIT